MVSKINIKKTIYLVIFINLILVKNINAQKLFDYLPPSDIKCSIYDFIIDNKTTIDSINRINWQINSISESINNYSISISISKLNETQIDSAIYQINDPRKVSLISFTECPIKKLPNSIKKLINLYSMRFDKCDSITSMNGFNSVFTIFGLYFENCRIQKLPDGVEKIKPMLRLMLEFPNDFEKFDLNFELFKFNKRKNIIDLYVKYKLLKEFPESLFDLTSLQTLIFYNKNINNYPPKFDKLVNLINIIITTNDDKVVKSIDKIENKYNFGQVFFSDDDSGYQIEKTSVFNYKKEMFYCDQNLDTINSSIMWLKNGTSFSEQVDLDPYILTIKRDTMAKPIKISISNISPKDSVKIILYKYNTNEIIKIFEYKNQDFQIELPDYSNNYPLGIFYLKIKINDKSKKWQIMNIY